MFEHFNIVTDSPHQTEPSPSRFRKDETSAGSVGKLFKVVAVSFGLLCVLQVSLNISLRLGFFTKNISECETEVALLHEQNNNMTEAQAHHSQQGWVQIGSSFYYISTETKSWQESRNDCLHREADLMIIDNQAEQRFAKALFREVWVGLTDAKNEGVWKWVDGTLLKETSFWCRGEPNSAGNEDCVEVNFEHRGCWNDKDCNQKRIWICEKKVVL